VATNPKFMKTLKRADERFAKTARREALDVRVHGYKSIIKQRLENMLSLHQNTADDDR